MSDNNRNFKFQYTRSHRFIRTHCRIVSCNFPYDNQRNVENGIIIINNSRGISAVKRDNSSSNNNNNDEKWHGKALGQLILITENLNGYVVLDGK
jgi:hypothetical protein